MHRCGPIVGVTLALLLTLPACLTPRSNPGGDTSDPELARLAGWMTGSFSSQKQHLEDPEEFFDIRLRMVRVWAEREDGYWLYVEQAVAQAQDRPYRQRIYQVTRIADGLYESRVYSFDDPLRLAGAWQRPESLAELQPEALQLRKGCAILLRPTGPDGFTGNTVGRGCASDLRGASYAVARVQVTPAALISWDQGFDEQDRQVWGPVKGAYVFEKLEGFPLESP